MPFILGRAWRQQLQSGHRSRKGWMMCSVKSTRGAQGHRQRFHQRLQDSGGHHLQLRGFEHRIEKQPKSLSINLASTQLPTSGHFPPMRIAVMSLAAGVTEAQVSDGAAKKSSLQRSQDLSQGRALWGNPTMGFLVFSLALKGARLDNVAFQAQPNAYSPHIDSAAAPRHVRREQAVRGWTPPSAECWAQLEIH